MAFTRLGTGTLVSSSIAHVSSQVGINAWGDGSVRDRQHRLRRPTGIYARGAGSSPAINIAYATSTASMAGTAWARRAAGRAEQQRRARQTRSTASTPTINTQALNNIGHNQSNVNAIGIRAGTTQALSKGNYGVSQLQRISGDFQSGAILNNFSYGNSNIRHPLLRRGSPRQYVYSNAIGISDAALTAGEVSGNIVYGNKLTGF